jgi:hypothetical protein
MCLSFQDLIINLTRSNHDPETHQPYRNNSGDQRKPGAAGLAPAAAAERTVTTHAISESPIEADSPELREPAGQYYSSCINLGVSHNWTNNNPSTCPGTLMSTSEANRSHT